MYQARVRVPTDQFAYIEADVEGTPDEIIAAYKTIRNAYQSGEGLPDKEYNQFIDNMLLGEQNQLETYQRMTERQQDAVQVIKRALKRINNKQQ